MKGPANGNEDGGQTKRGYFIRQLEIIKLEKRGEEWSKERRRRRKKTATGACNAFLFWPRGKQGRALGAGEEKKAKTGYQVQVYK